MQTTTERQLPLTTSQRWTLGLAAGASFIAALDGMVVTTAMDSIRRDLSASIGPLSWTMTGYSLSFAALLMAGAALGDRFGRRRMFVLGLLLFALASAACAGAPDIRWLIAARTVQGAASALVVPVALALLGAAVTPAQRPRALGVFSSITGLALLSGPAVGGLIVDALDWRWVFWINLPLCLLACVLARSRLAESPPLAQAVDGNGIALLAVAMGGLVWGLAQGQGRGWGDGAVPAALSAAAASLLLFWRRQHRIAHALVPPRLLHSAQFRLGNAVCLLLFMSLMGTLFFMAQFFQVVHQLGASAAGWRMLPWTAALFVTTPLAGAWAGRVGERLPAVLGLSLQGAALLWMSQLTDARHGYGVWVAPLVLAGIGVAAAIPAAQNAVLGAVAPPDIGKASGVFNTLRQLGWAFGAAAAVAVFGRFGDTASAPAMSAGYAAVLLWTAGLSVLGALLAARLPRAAKAASHS